VRFPTTQAGTTLYTGLKANQTQASRLVEKLSQVSRRVAIIKA
jgi:hypothetical protein